MNEDNAASTRGLGFVLTVVALAGACALSIVDNNPLIYLAALVLTLGGILSGVSSADERDRRKEASARRRVRKVREDHPEWFTDSVPKEPR